VQPRTQALGSKVEQDRDPKEREKQSDLKKVLRMPPLVIENLDALESFVGREIATTDWFEITQDRIRQFSEATEDRQWIHLDHDRAQRESPYATTIAHGFLTLSLLSHLWSQALQIKNGVGMVVNYGLNRVRFPSPVHVDTKIRARFTLQSWKDVGNAHEAVFSIVVEGENQRKPCCVAEWIVRYYV
jgi:acyl dehydratase